MLDKKLFHLKLLLHEANFAVEALKSDCIRIGGRERERRALKAIMQNNNSF